MLIDVIDHFSSRQDAVKTMGDSLGRAGSQGNADEIGITSHRQVVRHDLVDNLMFGSVACGSRGRDFDKIAQEVGQITSRNLTQYFLFARFQGKVGNFLYELLSPSCRGRAR